MNRFCILVLVCLVCSANAFAGLFSPLNPNPEKERRKRYVSTLDSLFKENNKIRGKISDLERSIKFDKADPGVNEDSLLKLRQLVSEREQFLDSLRSWVDVLEANDRITGESLFDSLRTIAATDTASIREYLRYVGLMKDLKSPGRPDTPQLEWLDSTYALWQFCKEKGFDTRQGRMDIRLEYVMRYGRPDQITWDDGECTQIVEKDHAKYCIVYHWSWNDRMLTRDFEAVADGVEVSVRPTEEEKFGTKDGKEIHYNLRDAIDRMERTDTTIGLNLAQGDTILGLGAMSVTTSVLPVHGDNQSPSLVISAFGLNCDSLAVDSTGKQQFHFETLVRDSNYNIVKSYISRSWRVAANPGATVPLACTTSVSSGIYTFTHTIRDEVGKRFGFVVNDVYVPSPYVSKGSGEIVKVFSPSDPPGGASSVAVGDTSIRVKAGRVINRDDTVSVFVRFPFTPDATSRMEYSLFVNLFPAKKRFTAITSSEGPVAMTDTLGRPIPRSKDSTGIHYWPSKTKNDGSEWEIGEATLYNLVYSHSKGEELDSTFADEFFDRVISFYVPKDKFGDGPYQLRVMAIINGKKSWALLDDVELK